MKGITDLPDLVFVSGISAWAVVREGVIICEFMVGRGGSNDVAMACYLAGEASDWAGDWML